VVNVQDKDRGVQLVTKKRKRRWPGQDQRFDLMRELDPVKWVAKKRRMPKWGKLGNGDSRHRYEERRRWQCAGDLSGVKNRCLRASDHQKKVGGGAVVEGRQDRFNSGPAGKEVSLMQSKAEEKR